ncbi:WXG100 family type VII secretion target [Pseudactinotalea sp. Z1748]|uniref:WXG100 family type VII secretion target n=1 Tax=Pseudactinotalea sp. Z1748 TaxID=3413027 RepID=UPI003C7C2EDE
MSEPIVVTFDVVHQAADDLEAATTAMRELLDGMVAQLRPLETEWTGAAAQAYQARQREWDIEITEMVDLLGVLAGRVEASAQTYQSTEGDVRSAWA